MTPTAHTSFLAHVIIGAPAPDKETLLDIRLAVQQHLTECGITRGAGAYGLGYKDLIGDDYIDHDENCRNLERATWTGKNGIRSLDDLLTSPEVQRKCFANKLDAAYTELGKARSFEVRVNSELTINKDEFIRLLTVTTPVTAIAFAETGNLVTLAKAARENGFEDPMDMLVKVCVEAGARLPRPDTEEFTIH